MTQERIELANALARLFIARPDVRAIQRPNGAWAPDRADVRDPESALIQWDRAALEDHLAGTHTYGHYLLSKESKVKLFALDVDLNKFDPTKPEVTYRWEDMGGITYEYDPREAWADRAHPSRSYQKVKMRMLAGQLARAVHETLGLRVAVAYSGGKGFHVYGLFEELVLAEEARIAAKIVLDSTMRWKAIKGDIFYGDAGLADDTMVKYNEFTIELFPKQDRVETGGFGNLMALPLGRNQKSNDPKFFIDMTAPLGELKPADPLHSLTGDIWKRPGE